MYVSLTDHGIGQQCVEPATINPSTIIVGAVGAASPADYCWFFVAPAEVNNDEILSNWSKRSPVIGQEGVPLWLAKMEGRLIRVWIDSLIIWLTRGAILDEWQPLQLSLLESSNCRVHGTNWRVRCFGHWLWEENTWCFSSCQKSPKWALGGAWCPAQDFASGRHWIREY